MKYKQRDIVLVPFPYSDLSSAKRRPVLIISNDSYNESKEDVVVCILTSNTFSDEYSIPITNDSLEYGLLPEPSVIKAAKLFTIHQMKIVKKFSILNTETFKSINSILIELFKQNYNEV
jgi:mRNA interferase MazF